MSPTKGVGPTIREPSDRAGSYRPVIGAICAFLLGLGFLAVPPAWAEKNIEIDWDSGTVSVEKDTAATEEPPVESPCLPCGPEQDRLVEIVRKQQRLLQRQQLRIKELEKALDGERRINIRLNQLLKGISR